MKIRRKSMTRLITLIVLTALLFSVSSTALAGGGGVPSYKKKLVLKTPSIITIKARDKDYKGYHGVFLKKGGKNLTGIYYTREENGYTVKFMVGKGTYTLYASCPYSELKVKTSAYPAMGTSKTVKWHLVAKPKSGYGESDINLLGYRFKAPADGCFSFDGDNSMQIKLYDSNFKQICTANTRVGSTAWLGLQGGKTYYLLFERPSYEEAEKITVKCKFKKLKDETGHSRRRAANFKKQVIQGLLFAKPSCSRWIKYTVNGEDDVRQFYLNLECSWSALVKLNVYKNGELITTQTGGGWPLQNLFSTSFSKGDKLLFEVTGSNVSGRFALMKKRT